MRRVLAPILAASLLIGCGPRETPSPEPSPTERSNSGENESGAPEVEVQRLRWESSNPSLGLRDVPGVASVGPNDFADLKAWSAEMDRLLDGTQVNGKASLRDYVLAIQAGDRATVADIEAAAPTEVMDGAGQASLELVLGSGKSVKIANLKTTQLTGRWEGFWAEHLRSRIDRASQKPPM